MALKWIYLIYHKVKKYAGCDFFIIEKVTENCGVKFTKFFENRFFKTQPKTTALNKLNHKALIKMTNEKLNNKLAILHAKKYINTLKGMELISLSLEKPKNINWYLGELDKLDNAILPLYKLATDIEITKLAELLSKIINLAESFIIVIQDIQPIYCQFKINNLTEFLTSYFNQNQSMDLMLFFTNQNKLLDIFLAEDSLEIKIFENI